MPKLGRGSALNAAKIDHTLTKISQCWSSLGNIWLRVGPIRPESTESRIQSNFGAMFGERLAHFGGGTSKLAGPTRAHLSRTGSEPLCSARVTSLYIFHSRPIRGRRHRTIPGADPCALPTIGRRALRRAQQGHRSAPCSHKASATAQPPLTTRPPRRTARCGRCRCARAPRGAGKSAPSPRPRPRCAWRPAMAWRRATRSPSAQLWRHTNPRRACGARTQEMGLGSKATHVRLQRTSTYTYRC